MDHIIGEIEELKELCTGGQKKVYKGHHYLFGDVVLKTGKCSSNSSYTRIKREVHALENIDSTYFPTLYHSIFDDKNKTFSIVEEFISNTSLADKEDYFSTEEKILKLLLKLINGLKIIWDKKIVHRDIKPGNILIKENNNPVIIDLGIARMLDMEDLTLTMFSSGPRTPVYASPEQIMNKKSHINLRTDFFLLGLLIYKLYLGFHPYDPKKINNSETIVDNILNGKYYNLNDTDATDSFKILISKLLETKPYMRFRNETKLLEFINSNWEDII